jgi:hypothetical protein
MSVPALKVLKTVALVIVFGVLAGIGMSGCSTESLPPAPYLGERPLEFLRVTQNFTPDIQWVGGRVAAVGVNRGDRAALDSTLVWIRRAPGNSISSVVTIGPDFDAAYVQSLGGTPEEELTDRETYTFWLAEASVLDAGLDPGAGTAGSFADTTLTLKLVLDGVPRSALGVVFRIEREERIVSDHYVISWTPADVRFRRLAINMGTTGRWTEHLWHIVVPEGQAPSISSPVIVGVPPEGAQEATAWPDDGFMVKPPCPSGRRNYVLWAATDAWNESFLVTAPGYAQFQVSFRNFPEIETPRVDC